MTALPSWLFHILAAGSPTARRIFGKEEQRMAQFGRLRERLDRLETPKERLEAFIDMTVSNREVVAERGCPFGSLSAEFLKLGGHLAKRSRPLLSEPLAWIEDQFKQMGMGEGSFGMAVHLEAALRGVSLLTQSSGDASLMDLEARYLKQWLAGL